MEIAIIFVAVFLLCKFYSARLRQREEGAALRAQRQSLIIHEQTKRAIIDAMRAVQK